MEPIVGDELLVSEAQDMVNLSLEKSACFLGRAGHIAVKGESWLRTMAWTSPDNLTSSLVVAE